MAFMQKTAVNVVLGAMTTGKPGPVAARHGFSEAECAPRWMMHDSLLKREKGDAVIIGVSSTKHLEENLADMEKGPLPEEVLQALDAGWERERGEAGSYWH
ncbi:hypothetical protein W97_00402 [Coniosporium apollinis CBS 100218]|uniref:NADP-dependent oxidoreductase domain-containing protein n=1 Tax=Coniosporium apollinis (strain CBS 100218) TaxID=1168221 RepID=R7YH10_CONA1|nr:uncharacterized protein W97_00402 [Coniosporium apollinis CBS 100218]EON61190.1 hypothetical protein W97_00402 [Coniosporium apollinis CBS 100218]